MLKAGIVGLPNVGKSTLFNALTESFSAESANYPFCTIEPNTGMVKVQDARLKQLQAIAGSAEVIPAAMEFVDIAGLVRGASKGEGLGNQFLANIREVDAIVHVVRCFEDENIQHVDGAVDPIRDSETISLELCLADAGSIEKRTPRLQKLAKTGDKEAKVQLALFEQILPVIEGGQLPQLSAFSAEEQLVLKQSGLICIKPVIYAANIAEGELAKPLENPHYQTLCTYAEEQALAVVPISAQIESELASLGDDDAKQEYLHDLGVSSSGVDGLIRKSFEVLGLRTYFTAGPKEARAWPYPLGSTAPQCAGVIHTDFEKGFIRAEVIAFDDYVKTDGEKGAKEAGLLRLEGKDYIMKDGDVVHFRFNV